jgi:alpha-1,2-mannosyltransferase
MLVNRDVLEKIALGVAGGIIGVMAFLLLGANGLLLASGQPVFGDFIAFWSAGRAALDGHAAHVHDVALISEYSRAAVGGVGVVSPWNSPPTFLLIASALATLPYPAAAILFLLASAALYLFAARKLLPDARALVFAATLPAAVYHLGTVQTGLLVAGVSALALVWLDKRPLTAGALVSLLVIKPHLAILWPVFLLLSGRWRAFAAACASAGLFVLIAGSVFGFESFVRFFDNLGASQELINANRIGTPAFASLYASLLNLGAPMTVAAALHALGAVAAIGVAVLIFRRGDRALGGAALCAATLLISPYLFFYDFTLLAVGAALLGAPHDRLELAAQIAAWSAGLSLVLNYAAPLPYCAGAAWLVLAVTFRRARSAVGRPAAAPQP